MKRVLKIILFLFVLGSTSLVTVIFLDMKYKAISPIYNKARPMFLIGGGEKCLNELTLHYFLLLVRFKKLRCSLL